MLGSEAGRSFREEVSDGQEKAHAGADHHGTAGGRSGSGERKDGRSGEPGSRDQRAVANLTLDKLILEEAAKGNF